MTPRTNRTPSVTPHPRPSRVMRPLGAVIVLAATLCSAAGAADAALTTDKCLVQKRQAWSTLRKCQANADVKRLKGKPTDLPKCQTKFQENLAKITAKATKSAIACRYGANGDGTVTDYDTGLMWETKGGEVGGVCLIFLDQVNHCVNSTFTWVDAQTYVGGSTPAMGTTLVSFLAGYFDWRLPTLPELQSIVTEILCDQAPCIDPIFGPTLADFYWSVTTRPPSNFAFVVTFETGGLAHTSKDTTRAVRAVRAAW
jgi:hypothetical protein